MADVTTNHWGLCVKDGSLRYDEDGRAHLYDTRQTARLKALLFSQPESPLHVEKVEVR